MRGREASSSARTPPGVVSLAVLSLMVALVVACDSEDRRPTPTAPGPATTASSPTLAAAPTSQPLASPAAGLPVALTAIINIILHGDAEALTADTVPVPTERVTEGPPMVLFVQCPSEVQPGTLIPTIRATACSVLWPGPGEGDLEGTIRWFSRSTRTLVAVYEENETRPIQDWVPRGSHVVVVWTATTEMASRGSAFHVKDGKIVGIRFGCSHKPEDYLRGIDKSRILIGPLPYN